MKFYLVKIGDGYDVKDENDIQENAEIVLAESNDESLLAEICIRLITQTSRPKVFVIYDN